MCEITSVGPISTNDVSRTLQRRSPGRMLADDPDAEMIRLHEAADRGLWEEPDPEVIAAMQQVYLELEGDLEDRG